MSTKKPKRYKFPISRFVADVHWALDKFNRQEGPTGFAWYLRGRARHLHELAIGLLRWREGSRRPAPAGDMLYADLVYDVLVAWGMNSKGAKLETRPKFRSRVKELVATPAFERLRRRKIREVRDDPKWCSDLEDLWELVSDRCRIMRSKSILVGSSKLLHHLQPDLFPPMDRRYTLAFLSALDPADPTSAKFRLTAAERLDPGLAAFLKAMFFYGHVARTTPGLRERLGEGPMSGSISKLIDNAVVAWWGD